MADPSVRWVAESKALITKKQILIVEDDSSLCELMRELLTEEGYEVECIGTALEALRVLSDRLFHLITLEPNLPDADGNTFLQQLGQTGQAIPVVVVSSNPYELEPHPLVKSIVTKPFNLDRFSATVRQYLYA